MKGVGNLEKDWYKSGNNLIEAKKPKRKNPSKGRPIGEQYIVELPTESYGICKTVKCTAFTDLANGVCQECWDRGLGGQRTYGFDKPRKPRVKKRKQDE